MGSRLQTPPLTHSHAGPDIHRGRRDSNRDHDRGRERSRSGPHHGGRSHTGGSVDRAHRAPQSIHRTDRDASDSHRIAAPPSDTSRLNPFDPSAPGSGHHRPALNAGQCRWTHKREAPVRAREHHPAGDADSGGPRAGHRRRPGSGFGTKKPMTRCSIGPSGRPWLAAQWPVPRTPKCLHHRSPPCA